MNTRAIRIHEYGGPEVLTLENVEVPEPAAGEDRIRHTAIGLNLIDTYHRSGLYPLELPAVIGLEGAGIASVSPGSPAEAAGQLLDFAGDDILVGHNVGFDISFIEAALADGTRIPFDAAVVAESARGWSRVARINGERAVTVFSTLTKTTEGAASRATAAKSS